MITLRMEVWNGFQLVEVFEKRVNYLTQRAMNQFVKPIASSLMIDGGKIVITAWRKE